VNHAFVRVFFLLGLLKIGGSEMCDVLFGVPECVTKCDRGEGLKFAKNSVTYFMDAPEGESVLPVEYSEERHLPTFSPHCTTVSRIIAYSSHPE